MDDDSATIQTGDVQVYAKDEAGSKVLSYPSYMTYYTDFGDTVRLEPSYAGYTDFTIDPALPEGITMNTMNGAISGQVTSAMVGEHVYHVNATNVLEQKQETATFTLSIRSGL